MVKAIRTSPTMGIAAFPIQTIHICGESIFVPYILMIIAGIPLHLFHLNDICCMKKQDGSWS